MGYAGRTALVDCVFVDALAWAFVRFGAADAVSVVNVVAAVEEFGYVAHDGQGLLERGLGLL